jgi:protein-tyrosine-phosphatase
MFERLLHSRRRRAARRLVAGKRIRSVVFLCNGNLFRSPYAAASLARILTTLPGAAPIRIESAGFLSSGKQSPASAVSAARRRGIDLSSHVSKLLKKGALQSVDLVVVMSQDHARSIRARLGPAASVLLLGDLDPHSIERRTIIDPLGCDDRVIERVYSRIDRCVEQLAALMTLSPRST